MHGRADAEAPPTIPDEAARMDDIAALAVMVACGRRRFRAQNRADAYVLMLLQASTGLSCDYTSVQKRYLTSTRPRSRVARCKGRRLGRFVGVDGRWPQGGRAACGQIAVWSPFQVKTVQGLVSGNFAKFSPFLVCLCYGVIREDASPFSNVV